MRADLLDQAYVACEDALSALKDCVGRCTVALNSEQVYDKDLVCHLAYLTKEVVALVANMRKLYEEARPNTGQSDDATSLFR